MHRRTAPAAPREALTNDGTGTASSQSRGIRPRAPILGRGGTNNSNSNNKNNNVRLLGVILIFMVGALLFLHHNDPVHFPIIPLSLQRQLHQDQTHHQPASSLASHMQPSVSLAGGAGAGQDKGQANNNINALKVQSPLKQQQEQTSAAAAVIAPIGGITSTSTSNVSTSTLLYPNTPVYDTDGVTRLHIVFSTDCGDFQHWQSYLMFFSAWKAGQPGHVTRIASGCTEDEQLTAQQWHDDHISGPNAMAPGNRFGIHFTPKFTTVMDADGKEVGNYKFFNKPLGLKHWMEHGTGMGFAEGFDISSTAAEGTMADEDVVVILIDPDMILLRPISSDFSVERETIFANAKETSNWPTLKVKHGYPFAQKYGLGTQWQTFGLATITGDPHSPALEVNKVDGRNHYPAGPPYIGTARDMYAIAQKWTEFAPKVHAEYPYLLAEMYAYCIAAAHLKLPHKLIVSGMISNTGSSQAEGWAMIDKIPAMEVCDIASNDANDEHSHEHSSQQPQHDTVLDKSHARYYALPNVIHYCQRYAVGDWFFSKRKHPKDFFTCSKPLMAVPPQGSNVALETYQLKPPGSHTKADLIPKQAKRNAFMVCGILALLNQAATFYKSNHCSSNHHHLNDAGLNSIGEGSAGDDEGSDGDNGVANLAKTLKLPLS
jgi:hypothetical protein